MLTRELGQELAIDIAGYIVEQVYTFEYPYVTQSNGDVTYTEEAQEVFNEHYDTVYNMLEDVIA